MVAPPPDPVRRRVDRRIVLSIAGGSAIASAIFGWSIAGPDNIAWLSALQGVVNSLVASVPIVWLETAGMRGRPGRMLRRLPFALFVLAKTVIYLSILIVSIEASRWIFSHLQPQSVGLDGNFFDILLFAGILALVTNIVIAIGTLLGWSTMIRLLTGRYHRPRREERIFLSVDLVDSTGLAERLGDRQFHALLNAFFSDVADAAVATGGEIYKYVGDEVILTWSPAAGLAHDNALRCPQEIRRYTLHAADHYRRRFATLPQFRAALHIGEVIAGEVGDLRREIGYFGDTLNTLARMSDATKELGVEVLVSRQLLQRSPSTSIAVRPLPPLALRGKTETLDVAAYSLSSPEPSGRVP